jgi:sortase A
LLIRRRERVVLTAAVAVAAAVTAAAATSASSRLRAGEAFGTLSIPRIGLVSPVQQGGWDIYTAAWPASLKRGPAHYPNTPMPWQAGTTAFAGHRTTFTHPFLNLNRLRRGDRLVLRTVGHGTFVYRVTKMRVLSPDALWILHAPRVGHHLVLTACHPPHSAKYRLVVWASLSR